MSSNLVPSAVANSHTSMPMTLLQMSPYVLQRKCVSPRGLSHTCQESSDIFTMRISLIHICTFWKGIVRYGSLIAARSDTGSDTIHRSLSCWCGCEWPGASHLISPHMASPDITRHHPASPGITRHHSASDAPLKTTSRRGVTLLSRMGARRWVNISLNVFRSIGSSPALKKL